MEELSHVLRPPDPAHPPEGALVLLHGRGTSEHDLQPTTDALDPERRLVGVTPRAPLTLPGQPGAHWYVVRRVGFPDPATFGPSYERLAAWLDALPGELGVPWSRTVLGGFSQGAAMALAAGLGRGLPAPAGILALSGFLPEMPGYEPDLEGRRGFPVAIAHGGEDPIIPVGFGRAARDRLVAAGADVLYRESPVGHTIDPALVPELRAWVAARVAPVTAGAPRGD
jgi:phospholipase/carboxylesterase